MRCTNQSQPRGVAMLLVLISLMMATILTVGYLASRDNSAAIGENVARAAAARWTADTGLDVGVAILQTETAWRTSHSSGTLLDDYALPGGTIDIDVLDLETGNPPTNQSEHIQLTSTAVVNGVEQVATVVAFVPLAQDSEVDIDLSEFAIFTTNQIEMKNDAIVTTWPMAPLSQLDQQVSLGTQSTSASSVLLENNSQIVSGNVYHGPGASNSLVTTPTGQQIPKVQLLDPIPLPASPQPPAQPDWASYPDLTISGGTSTQNTNVRKDEIKIKNGATWKLMGNITAVAEDEFIVENGAKIKVYGNATIVAFDDLEIINSGAIELQPNATLQIFVGEELLVDDGYVGDMRVNNIRDNTGNAAYMDPDRIQIFSMSSAASEHWYLSDNSVVKGNMYAPHPYRVNIKNDSALYGRIATKRVRVENDGALFYDPSLDSKSGFRNPNSPIFQADGRIKQAFLTLPSLDTSSLNTLASALGIQVKANGKPYGALPVIVPQIVLPTDPTPRPVEVDYSVVSYGSDIAEWEHSN